MRWNCTWPLVPTVDLLSWCLSLHCGADLFRVDSMWNLGLGDQVGKEREEKKKMASFHFVLVSPFFTSHCFSLFLSLSLCPIWMTSDLFPSSTTKGTTQGKEKHPQPCLCLCLGCFLHCTNTIPLRLTAPKHIESQFQQETEKGILDLAIRKEKSYFKSLPK